MPVRPPRHRPRPTRRRARPARLHLEPLETRALLSASAQPESVLREQEPNDTLDQAQALGSLNTDPVGVAGDIAAGPRADVDWYGFTLEQPARVTLSLADLSGQHRPGVLSLYNTAPNDSDDPFNLLGHRLLAQAEGVAGDSTAHLERALAAGTYYVAVSGAGNRFFHPFLADSGFVGAAGRYQLDVAAAVLPFAPDDGPQVLAADPAPDARLDGSPLILRVSLNGELDPGTIIPDLNVALTGPDGQPVPLQSANFSSAASELQLIPSIPLGPGRYQVFLAGDSANGLPVLAGLDGTSLGRDGSHPDGQDTTFSFDVTGVEGTPGADAGADDTPDTAHVLGDVTDRGLVQVAGVIGDDPTDPTPFNPADVDLYHFQVQGPGHFAFATEVFARRIGSSLDPGVSLFRLDPADGQLQLVAGNNNTLNATPTADHSAPLASDAALYAVLTAGDYYLAVTAGPNTPDPLRGISPGEDGIFDPEVTHSGATPGRIGPYVLNLQVWHDDTPPRVESVTPAADDTLTAPPTQLTVRFSETVNLQELAYEAAVQAVPSDQRPVYVHGADGRDYFPRLVSFDGATNEATFLMLDALPTGLNVLHLAGGRGLADLAGNLLAGNDASGDYVVPFTVNGPTRGEADDALHWSDREPNDEPATAQDLGVLFPHELQADVTLARSGGSSRSDGDDFYRLQVLQNQVYTFVVRDASLSGKLRLVLLDTAGQLVATQRQADGTSFLATLKAGTYVLHVSGWEPAEAEGLAYQITVRLAQTLDNPPPLTVGPAPVLRLRLVSDAPPVASAPTPVPTPPAPVATPPAPVADVPSPATPGSPPSDSSSVPSATPTPAAPAPVPVITFPTEGPIPPRLLVTVSSVVPASSPVSAGPAVTPPLGVVVSSPAAETAHATAPVAGPEAAPAPALTGFAPNPLAGLRAGPVGGVTDSGIGDNAPPVNRVLVGAPGVPSPAGLVRLAVLSQASPAGGSVASPATPSEAVGVAALVPDTVARFLGSWQNLLDHVFSVARWLGHLVLPRPVAGLVAFEDVREQEDVGEELLGEPAASLAPPHGPDPAPEPDWVATVAVALVGAVAVSQQGAWRRTVRPGLSRQAGER
jgi:Bacterial pre-peptidase C-terminal domain/Bacterial Ig-like domain